MKIKPAIISSLMLLSAANLNAMTADELRSSGKACEQSDGMLKALDAGVASEVDAINKQRMEEYKSIAASTGTDIAQVQQESGSKLQAKGGC